MNSAETRANYYRRRSLTVFVSVSAGGSTK